MHFDVFNNDAFSVSQLTKAINDLPHVPGRIGQTGLFTEEGISTTSVSIERQGLTLSLVPSAQRGAPGRPVTDEKRNLRSFNIVHLPQRAAVIADEIQNLRAFGSETEVQTLQTVVNKKLAKMRRDLDVTIEWQRMGAIKGQVLDADGTTVLLDMFTAFDVTQQTMAFDLDVDATKVKQKCLDLHRRTEDQLGGISHTGIRVFGSPEFMDALAQHPAVTKAYDLWDDGAFLRDQQRTLGGGGGFRFGNTWFEEYRGTVGGTRFIAAGEAYAVPEGVADLFVTHYGPADYMETVNTVGLPYYAKQEMMRMDKGVEIESQSNPLHLCTRPSSVIKLTLT